MKDSLDASKVGGGNAGAGTVPPPPPLPELGQVAIKRAMIADDRLRACVPLCRARDGAAAHRSRGGIAGSAWHPNSLSRKAARRVSSLQMCACRYQSLDLLFGSESHREDGRPAGLGLVSTNTRGAPQAKGGVKSGDFSSHEPTHASRTRFISSEWPDEGSSSVL